MNEPQGKNHLGSAYFFMEGMFNRQEGIHYFVVDTRPVEQYVAGHFPGAFNLDASLIVEKPGEFGMAVQSLGAFKAKTHPLDHLCLMGSGREEEDQYLHMLLASFLQKGLPHISIAKGGYKAMHDVLRESLSSRLKSHSTPDCNVCAEPRPSASQMAAAAGKEASSLLWRGFSAIKAKGGQMKDRVVDYAVNASNDSPSPPPKHAAPKEREKGKRYRNVVSAFSINDSDDSGGEDLPAGMSEKPRPLEQAPREKVKLKDWLNKESDLLATFECHQLDERTYMYPGHVVITRTHLFILRAVEGQKGWATVVARRPLANILKMTSKKRVPELLTLRHGYEIAPGESRLTASDSLMVPKAGDCAKAIKAAIMALQGIDPAEPPPPQDLPHQQS